MGTIRNALIATVFALPVGALAQVSTLEPFKLTGQAFVQGKGEAQPRPLVTDLGLSFVSVQAENNAAIGAQLTLSLQPGNRVFNYTGQVARDDRGVLIPYRFSAFPYNFQIGGRLPRLRYQGGKEFGASRTGFTAPQVGDVSLDLGYSDLCSVLVHFDSANAADEIIAVQTLGKPSNWMDVNTTPNSYFHALFVNSATAGAPRDLAAFLSTKFAGKDRATVEVLGLKGSTYEVTGSVRFKNDGGRWVAALSKVSLTIDDSNCGSAEVVLPVRQPNEKVEGSMFLEREAADTLAPDVTSYQFVALANDQVSGQIVSIGSGTLPASGNVKKDYSTLAEARRYHELRALASLRWADGRQGSFQVNGNTTNWSPAASAATKRGVYPDGSLIASPNEVERADFHSRMAFLTGESRLRGCVALSDVDMSQSAATMLGVDSDGPSFTDENGDARISVGPTRGAYSTGGLAPGSTRYELVGVPGKYREANGYFAFKRPGAGPGLDGALDALAFLSYSAFPTHDLVAGRANAVSVTHDWAFGQVVVKLNVRNPDGTYRPFHTPSLRIDNGVLRDQNGGALLGSYRAESKGVSLLKSEHKVIVVAPPGNANVVISAMVPENADGTGSANSSSFPTLANVPFRAPRPDGTCAATCAVQETQSNGTVSWAYYDDDERPPQANPAAVGVPAGGKMDRMVCAETAVVLTGTVSDESPVDVTINGYKATMSGTPPSQSYSVEVPLPNRINTISVNLADRCGGTNGLSYRIYRNCGPEITVPGTQTIFAGDDIVFTISGTDPDGDDLVFTGVAIDGNGVEADVTGVIDQTTGEVRIDGQHTQGLSPGSYTLRFTVREVLVIDGAPAGLTDTKDVIVIVRLPNNPPVIDDPGNQTIDEDDGLTITVTGSDPDGDTLTYSTSGPGSIDPNTGIYTLPAGTPPGSYGVTFTVTDGEFTDSVTITITVVHVNHPPVITVPGATTIEEGEGLSFTVTATDPDGDALVFSTSGPGGINPDTGAYTLPADTPPGRYEVTFTVSDGEFSDTKTVVITVVEKGAPKPNRPPEFEPVDSIETDGPGRFTVVVTDPDGDTLTCKADKLPPGATFDPVSMTVSWEGIRPSGHYTAEITCSDGELSETLVVDIRARVFDRVGGGWAGCSNASETGLFALLVVVFGSIVRRRRVA